MAKRFHSKDYLTVKDLNTYRIEIWDTEFASTSTEFETAGDIFTLRVNGEFRKKPTYIQPTEVTFSMNVATSTHAQFFTDLKTAQEGRFQIKIFRNTNFYWCGNVDTDNTSRPDLDTGLYFLEIQANDMLGQLQNVEFNNDGDPYTGTETLLGLIHKCLSKTGLLDFGWGASDVCIRTADNLYEDSMATGSTSDPLVLARTRYRAFYDVDKQGKYKYLSTYQVLENLLFSKGLSLMQSNGCWRIYSFKEMAASTLTNERRYDRDGVYLSSAAAVDITKTLDQDAATAAKENIVNFSSYPLLKEIDIIYKTKNWTNYLAGGVWQTGNSSIFDANGLTIDHNSNLTTLSLVLDFNGTTTNDGYDVGQPTTVQVPLYMVYKVYFKVGDRYLKRNIVNIQNYSVTYSDVTWSESLAYFYVAFYFKLPPNGLTETFGTFQINEITPNLLSSGAFESQVTFDSLRTPNTGATVGTNDYTIVWKADNGITQIYSNGNPLTDISDNSYLNTNDNAAAFSESLEIDTVIGDGTTPNSQGRIEVYDGADWVISADWQVGGAGTKYPLLSVVGRDIMAMRKLPVNRMDGSIYDTAGTMHAHSRIDDNSSDAVWLLVQGNYNARMERWTGTFFEIADSPTDITTADPVSIDPTPTPGGGVIITNPVPLPPTKQPVPTIPDLNGLIGSASTSGNIAVGSVTSITTAQTLTGGAFTTGQIIALIDPSTGNTQNFTVTADSVAGDTSIAVQGYATINLPPGSPIIVSPQNTTVQGYGASSSNSAISSGQQSNWFDIFQQWWEVDNDLDIEWPIYMPDIGMETDENAGDGATSGFRLDGDGLQSFDASNTTPGVKIGLLGKLELNNLDTGTGTDGLIVEGGVVKKKTLSTVITDHGALSGLSDDDHTQYHNDARGDARYYTETELDAGQLDNRYFTESEHINSSAGAGDAGKPIKLNASGVIDPTMYTDTDTTDHGALSGLADDDHTQYHNDARGDARYYTETELDAGQLDNRYFTESEHINSSAGAGDAGKPIKLDADGHVDKSMINRADIPIRLNIIDFDVDWAVAKGSAFFRVSSEYVGFKITSIVVGVGNYEGTGSGNNTVVIKLYDYSILSNATILSVNQNTFEITETTISGPTFAANDMVWFDITAIKSTPAQGLFVELRLTKV